MTKKIQDSLKKQNMATTISQSGKTLQEIKQLFDRPLDDNYEPEPDPNNEFEVIEYVF